APLDHAPSRIAVAAERALLGRLEGGCQVPVGALAALDGEDIRLYVAACNLDGSDFVAVTRTAPAAQAARLGLEAAEELLRNGGTRVLAQAQDRRALKPGPVA